MIIGFISGQKLNIPQPHIVADSIEYQTAKFEFQTADWTGADKWAFFSQGDKQWKINLKDDKIVESQNLNLTEGEWKVNIVGWKGKQRIPTNTVILKVFPSGALDGEFIPEPVPPVGEQILQKANEALEKSQSVYDDAEAGKFNGKDGKDGEKGETGNVYFASFKVVDGKLKMYSDPSADKIKFTRKKSRLFFQNSF